MKIFVPLVVVALLVVAAVFYFGRGELDLVPIKKPAAQAAPSQNFNAVSTLLQGDMNNIPLALDSPRIPPAHAFNVKSRLEGATAEHPEYQTLTQVCDLIIYADQEHSVRQMQSSQAEQKVSGDPMASSAVNQLSTGTTRASLHAKAQADWDAYRQQTDAEVHRLLASLQSAKL